MTAIVGGDSLVGECLNSWCQHCYLVGWQVLYCFYAVRTARGKTKRTFHHLLFFLNHKTSFSVSYLFIQFEFIIYCLSLYRIDRIHKCLLSFQTLLEGVHMKHISLVTTIHDQHSARSYGMSCQQYDNVMLYHSLYIASIISPIHFLQFSLNHTVIYMNPGSMVVILWWCYAETFTNYDFYVVMT